MSDDLTTAYLLGAEAMRSKLHKAADEIERLRAENEQLRKDLKTAIMGDSAELADMKCENEKLREALKRAAERDEERRKPIRLVGSEAAAAIGESGDD